MKQLLAVLTRMSAPVTLIADRIDPAITVNAHRRVGK